MYRKTYVEISVDNLKYNVKKIIETYPDYDYYFGIVKGNAYGHSTDVVKHLLMAGINYLCVSSLDEAIEIRNKKIKAPILCLEPIDLSFINEIIKNNIAITISNIDDFMVLKSLDLKSKIKVHLKIDTGMHRLGFDDKYLIKNIVDELLSSNMIELEGIFTHFATNGINDEYYNKQILSFNDLTSLIDLSRIKIIHMGKSETLINQNKIPFCNGIRLGLVMYGYNITAKENDYRPAFSLFSEIIELKKIKKDDVVGYGAKFKASKDCIVAIVPIGYADGFLRSNINGLVAIRNKRYKIIEINMGMIIVLVDEFVSKGDVVMLLGDKLTAKEVAERNDTIIYEILCLINNYVPRILK